MWRLRYLFPLVLAPLAALFTVSPSSLEAVAGLVPKGWFGGAGSCDIKGNISINTGERIYHVPGQEHYWETKISPQYGAGFAARPKRVRPDGERQGDEINRRRRFGGGAPS